ncbi:MAG: hypothetical protein GX842_06610 [Spirochaetales bacterium]|nr:hypothetical protein [Spirochaetales bacterium]
MKRLFIVIAIILIIALPLVAANSIRPDGFGAGLYLGWPMGLTVRYGMDDFRIFANVTNYFAAGANFDVGALYDIVSFDVGGRPLYINAGAQIGLGYYVGSLFTMAANGVVGASYYFDEFPLELFVNVALGYRFLGAPGFDYKAGAGGVWYF